MTVATMQTFFTYITALVVVLGGGFMLFVSRGDTTAGDLRTLVAGFIGAALTFVFSREVGASTAREAARQTLVANGNPNGHAPN